MAALPMDKEFRSIELWRCVVSECLATFFYVSLSCLVTLNWEPAIYRIGLSSADIVLTSLAFGLCFTALTQSFGHISGAHMNPAVSLGATITCKISPLRALVYTLAQCGGGIAGAALLYGMVPSEMRGDLGVTKVHASLSAAQGFAVEFLLSFLFIFTFNATVDPKRRNHGNQAVPLGLTVTLVHIVGFRLTGGSCNPARSLGPAFIKNHWTDHWIYWAGPMGGGLLSSLLYEYIFDPSRSRKHPVEIYKEQNPVYRRAESSYDVINCGNNRRTSLSPKANNGHENNAYENSRGNPRGHTLRASKRAGDLPNGISIATIRNEHSINLDNNLDCGSTDVVDAYGRIKL